MGTISRAGIVNGGLITATHITNIIDALDGTSSTTTIVATGSFSGSFKGDGSQITGVTGEWDGTLNGNASITGSLIVTAGVTASLQGSASYATTASFAMSSSRADSIPLAGIGGGEVQFNNGGVLGSSNRITISSNTLTITNGGTLIATGSLQGTASFATTASHALNVPPPSGPDAAVQFKSGSVFSGSANFKFDYTLNSLAQGSGNTVIGSNSHAEGENAKTGTQNAYYATSVSSGVVTLSSSYSNVSSEFVADNLLYLYDAPFDGIYQRAYFKISQSYYVAPNTIVELYDTSVTTTTAYVGDINYGVPNWTGDQTIPGDFSHAEGTITFAINSYAHAEGSATSAVGQNSHAEGFQTIALGDASHAEGINTQAIGANSHAEGTSAKASGSYSHAEGQNTQAVGIGSHAEGISTKAIGNYSHAEGQSTQAIGGGSHAEGRGTIALGNWSHAEGRDTIASGSYQTVVGQNNTHGDTTSLFIVGGGLGAARSDAFKVTHSSSILIPQTQSAAPSWTGVDGEIIPATVSGTHYLYMWMNGAWRSSSFA